MTTHTARPRPRIHPDEYYVEEFHPDGSLKYRDTRRKVTEAEDQSNKFYSTSGADGPFIHLHTIKIHPTGVIAWELVSDKYGLPIPGEGAPAKRADGSFVQY